MPLPILLSPWTAPRDLETPAAPLSRGAPANPPMSERWTPRFLAQIALRFSFLLLPFLFAASSPAAAPPLPEDIQKGITTFFNLLKQQKVDEAYELILVNTRIRGREDDVKALRKQTREAIATYGPILGFETIEQRRVGMSLMQIVCLSWSENFPLRWRFSYYRPGDRWRLLDIFVDDKIGELFDARAVRVQPMDTPPAP